jgi:cob(I)alamin adenosyltransferase
MPLPPNASPRIPKMYTRTGDQGYTGLLGKERVPKYDLRPEAYGQVDEAQAVLGMCRAGPLSQRGRDLLVPIERDLYHMMAELATAPGAKLLLPPITEERIEWLEYVTDELGQVTGPFTGFVLPGDSQAGALVHLARTVVRRAERAVARLMHEGDLQNKQVLRYLNRLSSFLFVLARYEDMEAGVDRPTFAKEG